MTESAFGYTLIEIPVERRLSPDMDAIVGVMGYARVHLRRLVSEIPAGCRLDLLAAGTAHNIDLRPVLGLYAPPDLLESLPNWLDIQRAVETWCDGLSDHQLREIGRAAGAPTWDALRVSGLHASAARES